MHSLDNTSRRDLVFCAFHLSTLLFHLRQLRIYICYSIITSEQKYRGMNCAWQAQPLRSISIMHLDRIHLTACTPSPESAHTTMSSTDAHASRIEIGIDGGADSALLHIVFIAQSIWLISVSLIYLPHTCSIADKMHVNTLRTRKTALDDEYTINLLYLVSRLQKKPRISLRNHFGTSPRRPSQVKVIFLRVTATISIRIACPCWTTQKAVEWKCLEPVAGSGVGGLYAMQALAASFLLMPNGLVVSTNEMGGSC